MGGWMEVRSWCGTNKLHAGNSGGFSNNGKMDK